MSSDVLNAVNCLVELMLEQLVTHFCLVTPLKTFFPSDRSISLNWQLREPISGMPEGPRSSKSAYDATRVISACISHFSESWLTFW